MPNEFNLQQKPLVPNGLPEIPDSAIPDKEWEAMMCLPADPIDKIMRRLMWGTYGKYAELPLTYVRLIDCSTDHLRAILITQCQIPPIYRKAISAIIESRHAGS